MNGWHLIYIRRVRVGTFWQKTSKTTLKEVLVDEMLIFGFGVKSKASSVNCSLALAIIKM